jgi:hypothetical protein
VACRDRWESECSERINVSASREEIRTDHAAEKGEDEEDGVREVNDAEKNPGDDCRRCSGLRQEMNPVHEIAVEEDLLKKCGDEIRDEPEGYTEGETLVPEESGVSVSTNDQDDKDAGGKEEPKASEAFEIEMSQTQSFEGVFAEHPACENQSEREKSEE